MYRSVTASTLSLLAGLALACGAAPQDAPQVRATKTVTAEAPREPASAAAPEDHAHDAPHGGKVATIGDKHLELTIAPDGHIDVFILDANTKPISSKNAQGKVKLTLADGIKEFPLTYDAQSDHLTAMAPKMTAPRLVALVDLTIDGKPYSARFEYEFAPHQH